MNDPQKNGFGWDTADIGTMFIVIGPLQVASQVAVVRS